MPPTVPPLRVRRMAMAMVALPTVVTSKFCLCGCGHESALIWLARAWGLDAPLSIDCC
jgi:hypothetical protein